MPHRIEIFTAGCALCKDLKSLVEIGKCAGCSLKEFDMRTPKNLKKAKEYGVKVVPTIIIDGKIRLEGKPNFPLICGEDFYKFLEENFKFR